MSKYAPIQNIGGLTCLLCHLILPLTKYTKVGSCTAGRTWARPKFQQNSPIKYCQTLLKQRLHIFMFIQSS
jgi:hypothetical protein